MNQKLLRIGEVSDMLGVSIDTLRKWDRENLLRAIRIGSSDKRYYLQQDIDEFFKLAKEQSREHGFTVAQKWLTSKKPDHPPTSIYCHTIDVFSARLQSLSLRMEQDPDLKKIFALIVAMAGEIGNNSYNHNLGNWPDIPGTLFISDLEKRYIVLADRGQGLLATLKKPLPKLNTHKKALETAFTKYISGRAPESRGNGLKFVKDIIFSNPFQLLFYTGDARLKIKEHDKKPNIQNIKGHFYHGCLAVINY